MFESFPKNTSTFTSTSTSGAGLHAPTGGPWSKQRLQNDALAGRKQTHYQKKDCMKSRAERDLKEKPEQPEKSLTTTSEVGYRWAFDDYQELRKYHAKARSAWPSVRALSSAWAGIHAPALRRWDRLLSDSKSVLFIMYSVNKCLIDHILYQKVSD